MPVWNKSVMGNKSAMWNKESVILSGASLCFVSLRMTRSTGSDAIVVKLCLVSLRRILLLLLLLPVAAAHSK